MFSHAPRLIQSTDSKNCILSVEYLDDTFSHVIITTPKGIQVLNGNDLSYLEIFSAHPCFLRKISPNVFMKSTPFHNNEIISIQKSLKRKGHTITTIHTLAYTCSERSILIKNILIYQSKSKLNIYKESLIERNKETSSPTKETLPFPKKITHFRAITDDYFVIFTETSLQLWSVTPFAKQSSAPLLDKIEKIDMLPNGLFFYQEHKEVTKYRFAPNNNIFGILCFPAVTHLLEKIKQEILDALPNNMVPDLISIITSYAGYGFFSNKKSLEEKRILPVSAEAASNKQCIIS